MTQSNAMEEEKEEEVEEKDEVGWKNLGKKR